MDTPKYTEDAAVYWRNNALGANPWEPGKLCVIPPVAEYDAGAVFIMIRRVENQIFDMMGGKSY